MNANDRQVGGEHYRREGKRETQHWDLMATLDVGYFPAVITKYVERHAEKAGRLDLEKSVHYAEKHHETETHRREIGQRRLIRLDGGTQEEMVADYVIQAGLSGAQAMIFHTALLRPEDTGLLVTLCRKYLEKEYPQIDHSEEEKKAVEETHKSVSGSTKGAQISASRAIPRNVFNDITKSEDPILPLQTAISGKA